MNHSVKLIAIPVVIVAVALISAIYIVDETEQVVVTRFGGKIIGAPKNSPGLYVRWPLIDQVNRFPKNLQEWDGEPGQIITADKTYIFVDAFARWKIVEPIKFIQTVGQFSLVSRRLDEIIDAAVRNFVTSFALIESVRNSNRDLVFETTGMDEEKDIRLFRIETGREKIMRGILEQAQPKLMDFGIELVDVKIKRINYVDQVRESVFDRMIAERSQIAEKFRSEGRGEAQKILGEKERDLKRITSEAYKTAQEIKGEADAVVTKIYADAYGKDPEFYSFVNTLDIYRESIDKESSLVLSTDSDFLKYLKGFDSKP